LREARLPAPQGNNPTFATVLTGKRPYATVDARLAAVLGARMKYVCIQCGRILPVDRDLDDDRTFESVLARHDAVECPHAFLSGEETWLQLKTQSPLKALRQ
jgi:DNA-directed RNA polymerase subunit RPC12/RpoP